MPMETCVTEEGDHLENENILSPEEVLEHHGIKGQRWGVRRFQNKDGSLTSAGKKRYDDSDADESLAEDRKAKIKRTILIGATALAGATAAYGAYRYGKFIKDKNVELAIEKGQKLAKQMMERDALSAKKFPDLFEVSPDIHYKSYVDAAANKARGESFVKAYMNVRTASVNLKSAQTSVKAVTRSAKNLKELGFPSDVLDEVVSMLNDHKN